jgi:hypothetical protein
VVCFGEEEQRTVVAEACVGEAVAMGIFGEAKQKTNANRLV